MGFHTLAFVHGIKKRPDNCLVWPGCLKGVLYSLAGNADDETGECYPSISAISASAWIDRKTAIRALAQLVAIGLVKDTGKRRGRTNQVKVYRFVGAPFRTMPKSELLARETVQKSEQLNSPNFAGETVPEIPGNSPKDGTRNQSGISHGINHTPLPPKGGNGVGDFGSRRDEEEDLIQHAEAQRILGELARDVFDEKKWRQNQWSARRLQWLDDALPIERTELELVDCYYRLPRTDPVRVAGGKPRFSFDSLLEHLSAEVQKIQSAKKEVAAEEGAEPRGRMKEPAGWEAVYDRIYGAERPSRPQSFWNLFEDERKAVLEELKRRAGG